MIKVSIIVPVYKVERYLSECIDSILSQTYSDFELILVDDGSPDRSGIICDEYAKKDNRIVVYHKPNGGVSSARNYGIEKAVGEWIMFVDSDDYIEPETLNISFKAIDNIDVDLVVFGIEENYFYNNTIKRPELKYIGKGAILQEEFEEADQNGWLRGPVCKLYKRNLIIQNNLRFDLNMSYGEDTKFAFTYFLYCKNVKVLPNYCYHYCFRNKESLTNKKLEWKYAIMLAKMLREVRVLFAEKFKMKESYYKYIQFIYASAMSYAIDSILNSKENNKYKIYKKNIYNLRRDVFMKDYNPGFKQSRKYSMYVRMPKLCYLLHRLFR